MTPRVSSPALGLALLAALSWAVPAVAQDRGAPVDTTGLAEGPFSSMEMLYERTIFNVDVLSLHMAFGPETAATFSELVGDGDYDGDTAERVAEAALASQDVLVRSRFLRDVSLDQFMDGLRDNLRRAREDGLLTPEQEETIRQETQTQYSILEGRGIREGETMWYRIRGDSLHVALEAVDGEILLEDRPVGPERRLAVLGGYLAAGSDFREKLVRSLFTDH